MSQNAPQSTLFSGGGGMLPDPPIMDGMLSHTVAVAVLAPELICFYFLKFINFGHIYI